MSGSKINMSNEVMRSRIKKYDTYQQRGNRTARLAPVQPKQEVARPVNTHNNIAHNKISQQKVNIARPAATVTSDIKPNVVPKHSQVKSPIKPQSKVVSSQKAQNAPVNNKKIAMVAVATAKTYENEVYPDNEITMYGRVKRKLSLAQKAMYGFGVLVLVFSMLVSVQSFITNNQAKEQIATLGENSTRDEQGVAEGTGDEPSEEPISESAIRAFQVPNPKDPRFIRIPELGVFARIKNLGVTPEGAVDAPKNIFDTGWYNGSARPGASAGASLVLGHVSGWTGPGVFKQINRLVPGSQFEIEKGNGEIVRYSVTKSEQLPVNQIDMSKILGTEVAGEHDMKLMTCSGRYNSETKTFEDRFVVYATQIK